MTPPKAGFGKARFRDRQQAWDWCERNTQGNCSVLANMGEGIAIFEYLADDFGFFRYRGWW